MKSRHEQFLLDRKTGLGGSDMAAIMGLSPWKTPLEVYCDKISTEPENISDSPELMRGRIAEKYVLEFYSHVNEEELETDLPMMRDKEYPFLIGNIDARIKDKNIIVEAKTVGGNPGQWGGCLPNYYRTQVAHYASLTDCDKVDIAVMFDRWSFHQYSYYRDEEFEAKIRQAAMDFWNNHVLAKVPPEAINRDDLNYLYGRSKPTVLKADNSLKKAVSDLKTLEMQKSFIEAQILNAKCTVMKSMRDNEILEDENGTTLAVWRNSIKRQFSQAGLKQEQPEIYTSYCKDIVTRTFRTC